jgi:hypothetical protein
MRVKILFWNYNIGKGASMLKESGRGNPLARLVKHQGVDVLILADCQLTSDEVLASMSEVGLEFSGADLPHSRVRFFGRLAGPELVPVLSDNRLDFFRLIVEGFEEVLIGAIHFYGRRDVPSQQSRHAKVARHYRTLVEAERQVGHDQTLIVGDFNMTPDEMGMVDPEHAFGALMTWDLARVHSDPDHGGSPRFYNPMWSLMGRSHAPGTYYWGSTDPYNIYWYCLDGVIVRPSLRYVFRDETLSILATIPDRDGRIIPLFRPVEKHWKVEFSDHLPIFFELDLRETTQGAKDG